MRHYTQLTIQLRYQIYGLKKAGFYQTEIADTLKVDKSSISRELKRIAGGGGWRSKQADKKNVARRLACQNANKFSSKGSAQVDILIREKLSLEQVSRGMLKNRVSIDDLPKQIDLKERIGDWEGDTVFNCHRRRCLTSSSKGGCTSNLNPPRLISYKKNKEYGCRTTHVTFHLIDNSSMKNSQKLTGWLSNREVTPLFSSLTTEHCIGTISMKRPAL